MRKYTKDSHFKTTYLMESLSDYFEILKDISQNENNHIFWYRGQFDESWSLEPNLFRYKRETADNYGRKLDPFNEEFHLSGGYQVEFPDFVGELEVFKKLVKKEFPKSTSFLKNKFDWLFLGQHYGLLTPLVDFSTDPLIALYFALSGECKKHGYKELKECVKDFSKNGESIDCAAIFVLLPEEINKRSSIKEKKDEQYVDIIEPIVIENYKSGVFDGYVTWNNVCFDPICLIAPKMDYRLIRQSGNFLCYGSNTESIDCRTGYRDALYKIFIPYTIMPEIRDILSLLDLTQQTVYGEDKYDNIGDKCKHDAKNKFNEKMKELSIKVRTQKK